MDFLQQQDAKKAEELDPGGVETSEGGRVCVVVLCWGVGGCRFWMWFDSGFGFGPGFGFSFGFGFGPGFGSGCGVGFGFCFGPVCLCT